MNPTRAPLMRQIRQWLFPTLLIIVGAAVFAWLNHQPPPPEAGEVEQREWPVAVQKAQIQTLRPTLELYGVVESPREARLGAAVSAEVIEVHTYEGRRVKSGELLVVMDDHDHKLLLRQREADLLEVAAFIRSEHRRHEADRESLQREQALYDLALKAVERLRHVVGTQSGSQSQLDQQRGLLEQQGLALVRRRQDISDHRQRLERLMAQQQRAEALRDQALNDLRRTRITAPFDGRITQLHVAPGSRVNPGDPLLSMFDSELVEVRAQIADRDLPNLRALLNRGRPISGEARIDGQHLTLTLDRLAGRVQAGRGGVDALFRIRPGFFIPELGRSIEVRALLDPEPQVVAVPSQALYGRNRVLVVRDGRIKTIHVRVAGRIFDERGHRLLVRSDELVEGDEIVVSPLSNAVDDLRVTVAPSIE